MITPTRKYKKIVFVDNSIESSMALKRRDEMKCTNFGSIFRPLYYLSRVWGLAPFSIVTNPNGEVQKAKIRLYDVLWFLIAIYVHLFFMNSVLNKFKTAKEKIKRDTWILLVSARAMEVFTFAHGILTIVMNICNRFKLISIVRMFIRFDREVCMLLFLVL